MSLAGQEHSIRSDRGYAMAALLVGLSVMAVLMSMALPAWSHMARREKEEELIWRGQQYARAVGLFMRKFANTYPPTLDVLVEQRFLRKKYKDPITDSDFQIIPAGGQSMPGMTGPGASTPGQIVGRGATPQMQSAFAGIGRGQSTGAQPSGGAAGGTAQGGGLNLGIQGVVSKSKDASIKIYNGRQKYNEWTFVYLQTAQRIAPGGAGGAQTPGGRGNMPGRGGPGQGGFPGGAGVPGRGGRGFEPMPAGRPPLPFQPGQAPFGQPGQQPPFGQPAQPPVFGQPQGQPPFGSPMPGRGSTRPPGD
jgi:type II secretory pathway pseudopilin PulG